ncbi:MAG TPA: hypothetical protein VJ761_00505 [Ktedonobacteraceae bacterium]|nr:hypothetical protein [Ktedonobacteraceae bacterium]
MKIIFSRKGFDASIGKVPSPIFPSGELCSLPIPENTSDSHPRRYEDIKFGNLNLGVIVHDLSRHRINPCERVHLDPDLNATSLPRRPGWRPIFGQADAAERHLQNHKVKDGDLFIFYGWFRQVEQYNGAFRYVKDAPDQHVIFGWLQIERRIAVDNRSAIPAWALDHAHCIRTSSSNADSIYISTDRLQLPGTSINLPGAGVFPKFDPVLRLTAPGVSRSTWRLPLWFYPAERKSTLSYHTNLSRWKSEQAYVLLKTVGRGQEFILDCQDYPEAVTWLSGIFSTCFSLSQNLPVE